ncbi:unnamed protein product [Lactuca saligna]|uniref:Uncharacterized protein n=1 Tax=Lactuca saligna TaxID=75948 RepID=A0AA35YQ73_LACSI|nr:unnamed protein product [Lactuca saligna]
MAASLFTFSSTSRRVVPTPNSPPIPIYIKATNFVFNPDIPDVHRGLGLDDFVNFLVSCRLRYAISDVPSEFFPEQVCEFYNTAMVNDENNIISGTIGRGRNSIFITADLLSAALRSRSSDQLSTYEQQVVCSLLLNKCLDYGAFFFDQLVQLLCANVRADHVPFPRWIALVLDKFFVESYYSHFGNPIQCPRMSVQMYQDDPMENDIGISDRMREWITNPYIVPSLTADTDEGADGNNKDHADQQAETQGSTHPRGSNLLRGSNIAHKKFQVLLHIPASIFNELLTLTRDMSQRLLRIEADVHQLKGVLLPNPSPGPQHDGDKKKGEKLMMIKKKEKLNLLSSDLRITF